MLILPWGRTSLPAIRMNAHNIFLFKILVKINVTIIAKVTL